MKRLIGLAIVIVGFVAFLGYIGYFGGEVFIPVPATAKPAPGKSGLAAVLLSGDMGFNIGMGSQIARKLAADGIPVIGVNSLTFFRHERTPAEVKALIAEATRRALAFGHADHLILIGQSFGADMLHVGLTGLPQRLRNKISLVALVVPTDSVIFRASPSELFNWARPDALAVTTARRLNWVPAICIYGVEETDSLCPNLHLPNIGRVALPGGHPLHRDVDAVHDVLSTAIGSLTTQNRQYQSFRIRPSAGHPQHIKRTIKRDDHGEWR